MVIQSSKYQIIIHDEMDNETEGECFDSMKKAVREAKRLSKQNEQKFTYEIKQVTTFDKVN